jgi:hypothetical protein
MCLKAIVREVWTAQKQAQADSVRVLRPAIPIAWFGDLAAYRRSPLRIITVGLNPSRSEFPLHDPLQRFPRARIINDARLSASDNENYVGALNRYFQEKPYRLWFDRAFQWLLAGMDASFYGEASNTALHTDLCSPIATDPTWSGLSAVEQAALLQPGQALWHNLVRCLSPNLILVSVARTYVECIRFRIGQPRTIFTVQRNNPYIIEAQAVEVLPKRVTMLVFGRAATTPFGLIGAEHQRLAGKAIVEHFRAHFEVW